MSVRNLQDDCLESWDMSPEEGIPEENLVQERPEKEVPSEEHPQKELLQKEHPQKEHPQKEQPQKKNWFSFKKENIVVSHNITTFQKSPITPPKDLETNSSFTSEKKLDKSQVEVKEHKAFDRSKWQPNVSNPRSKVEEHKAFDRSKWQPNVSNHRAKVGEHKAFDRSKWQPNHVCLGDDSSKLPQPWICNCGWKNRSDVSICARRTCQADKENQDKPKWRNTKVNSESKEWTVVRGKKY